MGQSALREENIRSGQNARFIKGNAFTTIEFAPVNLWIVVHNKGEVLCAHCECVAGLGECCSHVEDALFSVKDPVRNIEQISVTDKKAYWITPNQKLGEPNKVKRIDCAVHSKAVECDKLEIKDCDNISEPTIEKLEKFLAEINKIPIKSAVLNVTAPYCYDNIDKHEEENAVGLLTNLFSTENHWQN
ncbi:hypothetical protein ILUMI_03629 [Ignelater luminosus]|uniref:SWIM-type domain-containing protein n=1 Tax=Ignelater luminosus TaxID=2038154 RepID=A0A8K0DE57_IGNLU|nr:hypothetical protein ILUMI_03629 [Ignelater luminosus]